MRLLETHGCQGGAHAGYVRAGWDVTGVDINRNHARYYPGRLIIADAATYIREHGHEYDAIHTSPACQWYCRGNAKGRLDGSNDHRWQRSIPPIREALESTGRPFVIENVTDAAWDMREPVALCGCMFNLSTVDTDGIRIHLKRERMFETNWGLTAPRPCNHDGIEWWAGAYGGARRRMIRLPDVDLRALTAWNRANARCRAEYAAHPLATDHPSRWLATCDHCTTWGNP